MVPPLGFTQAMSTTRTSGMRPRRARGTQYLGIFPRLLWNIVWSLVEDGLTMVREIIRQGQLPDTIPWWVTSLCRSIIIMKCGRSDMVWKILHLTTPSTSLALMVSPMGKNLAGHLAMSLTGEGKRAACALV